MRGYIPRSLEFEELISTLLKEHEEMIRCLTYLEDALTGEDYVRAAETISSFKDSLRQHIIDEEARILKILLNTYGRRGAEEAIRVFQQHQEIYRLVEEMEKTVSTSPKSLYSKKMDLDNMLHTHLEAEKSRIFPWAVKTHRETAENL